MATIDVQELVNRASDCLARVRLGETLVVTENDEPFALISPTDRSRDSLSTTELERIQEMVAQGLLRWNGTKPKGLPPGKAPVMTGDKTMSDLVLEDRGER